MRHVKSLRFVIMIKLALILGLCTVRADGPENTLNEVKRVLDAPHGINWISGNEIMQLADKMKNDPDKYLASIDLISKVGVGFDDESFTAEELRHMEAAIGLMKYIGGESGKKLLLKWYRLCSDSEVDIRRTVQEMSQVKDVKPEAWFPLRRAADEAMYCRGRVVDALGTLNEDSLIDDCIHEMIRGNPDLEVVMLRYLGRVARGRKDLISKIEERQANVQKGSSEEIALRKVLRKLSGPSGVGQQTEKILL